jgi:hypothetical protein
MSRYSMTVLAGLALAAMSSGPASAEDAHINSMSYAAHAVPGFAVINVHSSDGLLWDTIAGPPLKFTADMDVDTKWPGYVAEMGIFNGFCVDGGCAQKPQIHAEGVSSRDLHWFGEFELPMEDIPISTEAGFAVIPLGDDILEVCNAHLSVNGATDLYVFNFNLWTSFSVNTRKQVLPTLPPVEVKDGYSFAGGDETRQDSFVVQVRCNPYDEDFDDDVPNQDFNIEAVNLYLSTFSNEVTHPDPDTECRKGRILVRVTTNQAGPVAMRLWTAMPAVEDEYIETWSSHVGSGVYEAEIVRWVSVYETTLLQAMVEVENGIFDLQDGWDDLVLECVTDTPDFTIGDPTDDDPGRGRRGELVSP